MKKLYLIVLLLVGCHSNPAQIEYGTPLSELPFDDVIEETYNQTQVGIQNLKTNNGKEISIEIIDTQFPIFTKEVDTIENFDESYQLENDFEAIDVVDGELEVKIVDINKDMLKIMVEDVNGNKLEKEIEIKLDNSIKNLSEEELKDRFENPFIEKPKPIEPPKEHQ